MTGVMYLSAIRAASIANEKQSPGVAGATIGTGLSPLRPYSAMQQVRLLGLGRHAGRRAGALDVDDDERQLGHDREADRLLLSATPGPDVPVRASAPP